MSSQERTPLTIYWSLWPVTGSSYALGQLSLAAHGVGCPLPLIKHLSSKCSTYNSVNMNDLIPKPHNNAVDRKHSIKYRARQCLHKSRTRLPNTRLAAPQSCISLLGTGIELARSLGYDAGLDVRSGQNLRLLNLVRNLICLADIELARDHVGDHACAVFA